jgi:hypothetical protein
MVYYFTCVDPDVVVYMGKDKFENEDLIKYHFAEDVWFHVDKHSSAHVYVRLKPDQDIATLDPLIVEDLAQLTKENSIQGKKEPLVKVIYTMASNLKKSASMEVGEVGFHDRGVVYSTSVKRNKEILSRLRKTMDEKYPIDLKALKEEKDRDNRDQKKREIQEKKATEKEMIELKRIEKEAKSYDSLFKEGAISNKNYDIDDVFGDGGGYEGGSIDDFL